MKLKRKQKGGSVDNTRVQKPVISLDNTGVYSNEQMYETIPRSAWRNAAQSLQNIKAPGPGLEFFNPLSSVGRLMLPQDYFRDNVDATGALTDMVLDAAVVSPIGRYAGKTLNKVGKAVNKAVQPKPLNYVTPLKYEEAVPYTGGFPMTTIRNTKGNTPNPFITEFEDLTPNEEILERFIPVQRRIKKNQYGGLVNNTGYLDDSLTKYNPVNIIPSNTITMDGVSQPIVANGELLQPNSGTYKFDSPYVVEQPLNQNDMNNIKRKGGKVPYSTSRGKKSKIKVDYDWNGMEEPVEESFPTIPMIQRSNINNQVEQPQTPSVTFDRGIIPNFTRRTQYTYSPLGNLVEKVQLPSLGREVYIPQYQGINPTDIDTSLYGMFPSTNFLFGGGFQPYKGGGYIPQAQDGLESNIPNEPLEESSNAQNAANRIKQFMPQMSLSTAPIISGLNMGINYIDGMRQQRDSFEQIRNEMLKPIVDPNFIGYDDTPLAAKSGIKIKPENRGKFTKKANNAGMEVQEFASKVLSNKEDYSPATVKQANFAKNSKSWKRKQLGGIVTNNVESTTDPNLKGYIDKDFEVPETFANVEVEGGEFLLFPDGGTSSIKGKKHHEGGEFRNYPDGTLIYSQNTKLSSRDDKEFVKDLIGKKFKKSKSIADIAKMYDTSKEDEIINDRRKDDIAKRTAQINKEFKNAKLTELFNYQEMKKNPDEILADGYAQDGEIVNYGGFANWPIHLINPAYPMVNPENNQQFRNPVSLNQVINPSLGYRSVNSSNSFPLGPYQNYGNQYNEESDFKGKLDVEYPVDENFNLTQPSFEDDLSHRPFDYSTGRSFPLRIPQGNYITSQNLKEFNPKKKEEEKDSWGKKLLKNATDKVGNFISDLTELAPEFLGMAQALNDYPVYTEQLNPVLDTPYTVNVQDQINRNYAQTRPLLNTQGNPSVANVRATQAQANLYDANNQIYSQKYNIDNQIRNQVNQRNNQLVNQFNQLNKEERIRFTDRLEQRETNKRRDIQAITNSAYEKAKMKQLERRSLPLIQQMSPNYRYNPQTGILEYITPQGNVVHNNTGVNQLSEKDDKPKKKIGGKVIKRK